VEFHLSGEASASTRHASLQLLGYAVQIIPVNLPTVLLAE